MIILILMVFDHYYHAMVMIDKTSDELEIRCGDLDVTGEELANEVFDHQQRKVAKVVLHPEFLQREVAWQSQWDGVG